MGMKKVSEKRWCVKKKKLQAEPYKEKRRNNKPADVSYFALLYERSIA